MNITILQETGYEHALLALSLSHNAPLERMSDVAKKLGTKDGGHNKFLEMMQIWLDITAPRYWWQQFDTYRIGITKDSESTMHTIMKRPLSQADFQYEIYPDTLDHLNALIEAGDFDQLKNDLPEGFLQRRIVNTNYKTIRNIINQRQYHKLSEWTFFCHSMQNLTHYHIM